MFALHDAEFLPRISCQRRVDVWHMCAAVWVRRMERERDKERGTKKEIEVEGGSSPVPQRCRRNLIKMWRNVKQERKRDSSLAHSPSCSHTRQTLDKYFWQLSRIFDAKKQNVNWKVLHLILLQMRVWLKYVSASVSLPLSLSLPLFYSLSLCAEINLCAFIENWISNKYSRVHTCCSYDWFFFCICFVFSFLFLFSFSDFCCCFRFRCHLKCWNDCSDFSIHNVDQLRTVGRERGRGNGKQQMGNGKRKAGNGRVSQCNWLSCSLNWFSFQFLS